MTIRSLFESGRIFLVVAFVFGMACVGIVHAMPPQGPAETAEADTAATTQPVEPTTQPVETATQPSESGSVTSAPATRPADDDEDKTPLIEVYIPSVTTLVKAAAKSRTADISRAMAGVIRLPEDETGEGLDFGALLKLLKHVGTWPDTSVAFTVFPQDKNGRALWAAELDWSLDELRERVAELLAQDVAQDLLKDVALKQAENGVWQVELPDVVLAVLVARGEGSIVLASRDMEPPDEVYGQEQTAKAKKAGKSPRLVYAQMRGDSESSPISQIPGVKDASYYLTLRRDGQWVEGLMVRWNMMVGTGAKILFQKTKHPFSCPADAYCLAAYNFGPGEGLADSLVGLSPGVIGRRVGSAVGMAVVPGSGFLPLPDVYFQFRAHHKKRIIESIRSAIEEDWKMRKDDDQPRAWFEEQIGDRTVFWYDPSVDHHFGIAPATYRTVIFFDGEEAHANDDEEKDADSKDGDDVGDQATSLRLIIAQTSTWAEDAVANWDSKTGVGSSIIEMPNSKKSDWQARIRWHAVYSLLQPYLCLITSSSEDVALPPSPEDLESVLSDSVLDLRIHYAGLQVRHRGPLPGGALLLPTLIGMSLSATGDASSEAARERVAARHLRVLHHHAELFKRDYGRWPATVAELDGYVDFASHPYLLYLRPRERSTGERILSAFVSRKRPDAIGNEDEEAIDDSLYEIEWSEDTWRLKLRAGEFTHYETIYVDEDGEIHRVPKADAEKDSKKDEAATTTTSPAL